MENNFSIPGLFYKYRSLENLERFLSIIIDRKLYGALYSEMNDRKVIINMTRKSKKG